MWVRGLKPKIEIVVKCPTMSHPVWVRGLKLGDFNKEQGGTQSHPVWVRGLKLTILSNLRVGF